MKWILKVKFRTHEGVLRVFKNKNKTPHIYSKIVKSDWLSESFGLPSRFIAHALGVTLKIRHVSKRCCAHSYQVINYTLNQLRNTVFSTLRLPRSEPDKTLWSFSLEHEHRCPTKKFKCWNRLISQSLCWIFLLKA